MVEQNVEQPMVSLPSTLDNFETGSEREGENLLMKTGG